MLRLAAQSYEDDDYLQAEAHKLVQKLADGSSLNFTPLLTLYPLQQAAALMAEAGAATVPLG
ncbi:MAG: hypothetical protein U0Y68_06200 [Blastocatellia bacterium]